MTVRPAPKDHYSYTVYADPDTARTFDERRFGGPIGELIAADQAQILSDFIGKPAGLRILDVGTGTGRAALQLARAGAEVIAIDASDEMLAVASQRAQSEGVEIRFEPGDAHALEYGDRAFDVAISLRVLMHTPEWTRCLSELCRVSARLVVFDYPSASSLAALESMGRRVTHALGARTEPYRVFGDSVIARELDRAGFRVRAVHRQFVLPIALHKAIGSRAFTERAERLLGRAGLLALVGSPVTVVAERCVSS